MKDECQSHIELFELLFSDKIFDHVWVFIAVLILSGYIHLPQDPLCWEMTENTHDSTVTSLFTRNRFNEVFKNLHLADNDNLDNSDKFAKVCPIIEVLNKNCLSDSIPERHMSIDELMVPYYRRRGCKHCMQSKPETFGYKL